MVFKYTSTIEVSSSKVSLMQLFRVWSDVNLMPKWDKDCHSARLVDGDAFEEGKTLFITLQQNKESGKENCCKVTRVTKPSIVEENESYAGIHFVWSTFLANLSFQYEV